MWRCFCFHSPSLLSWGALFPPTAFERITAVSLVARESAHPQIHTHIHAHTDAHLVGSATARLRALLSLFTSPAHFRFSVNLALFLNIMKLSQRAHTGEPGFGRTWKNRQRWLSVGNVHRFVWERQDSVIMYKWRIGDDF